MYTLANPELSVTILDPIADVERLGSRYCTGGYIYQVTDAVQGELFSGPQYPAPYPDVFDGQGAPDMFHRALGAETAPVDGEVGCIGVGRVRRTSPIEPFDPRHNREVIEFVRWEIKRQTETITMQTEHAFRDWAYRLIRQVTLVGRSVHASTEIHSLGKAVLPVRWFAHPFFPLTTDQVMCRFSIPVSMPENPGYLLNAEGFICYKGEFDWQEGYYQPLDYAKTGQALTVVQRHPKVGQVTTVTDFLPTFLPIWGNDRTFSFEPYFEQPLKSGEKAKWSIVYRFGSQNR